MSVGSHTKTVAALRDPAGQAAPSVAQPRRRRDSRRRNMRGWLLILPLLAVNVCVVAWPSLQALGYSFTNWDGVSTPRFIGLANYRMLWRDPSYRDAFEHNLLWMVFFLVVPMSIGLFGAFLLSRITRFQLLFRLIYFVPYTVASIITASIWSSLVSVDNGIGKYLDINFLGSQFWALPTVAFINSWAWWGFLVVIFLTAMRTVSPSLYEAAQLDGAGALRQFRSITLPSIRPTLVFLGLMTIIWSFLAFDYVYVLTSGGPAGATDVVATLLYRTGLQSGQPGYASAMGVVMSLISAAVVVGYMWLRRRKGWVT